MEKLPITFVQATVDPDILECFTPAFNFTKINSSNGRLAFVPGKVYWLPDEPIALMDQGWVINVNEIAGYGKWGISGFSIKLVDGKELRFSNVGSKMRDGIAAAIEAHKGETAPEGPAAPAAEAAEAAPEAAPAAPAAAPEEGFDPDDAGSHKLMGILAYLGILVLIPLFAAKESKFTRFHVNQGLILLICSVVVIAIGKILPSLAALVYILDLVIFVFAIIGIVNVVKGRAKALPLIGKFTIIK